MAITRILVPALWMIVIGWVSLLGALLITLSIPGKRPPDTSATDIDLRRSDRPRRAQRHSQETGWPRSAERD